MCQQVSAAPNPLAKEELNLLARLMGGLEVQKPGNADTGFRINLFATDEEEEWVSIYIRCIRFFFFHYYSKCEKYFLFSLKQSEVTLWLCYREALISRPDELSYGVINIQATKVNLNDLKSQPTCVGKLHIPHFL